MELLLLIFAIALACIAFVHYFPVSVVRSETRLHQTDKRHRYYRGREGEDYDDD